MPFRCVVFLLVFVVGAMMVNKQVDAILGDDCILAGFKNNDLRIINKAYSREYYAVAVRKSEKSKELLNAINAAIAVFILSPSIS